MTTQYPKNKEKSFLAGLLQPVPVFFIVTALSALVYGIPILNQAVQSPITINYSKTLIFLQIILPVATGLMAAFWVYFGLPDSIGSAVQNADAINVLRVQLERQKVNLFPSVAEYAEVYGVSKDTLARMKPDGLVMHPGPMNRGVEIASDVADDMDRSAIQEQVEMGVAVRMACLDILTRDRQEGQS